LNPCPSRSRRSAFAFPKQILLSQNKNRVFCNNIRFQNNMNRAKAGIQYFLNHIFLEDTYEAIEADVDAAAAIRGSLFGMSHSH
jgi:hypothetical protein